MFDISIAQLLAQGEGGGSPLGILPAFVAIGVLFYFMIIRPERRRQLQQRQLLENVKKNDRVITAGGIYGVVTNVQREVDAVTIKVDEENNTKLRITLGSIQRIIVDDATAEKTAGGA